MQVRENKKNYELDFKGNRELKKFLKILKRKFNLSKIILFGSRAKGNYLKESDYDLIIVSDYFKNIPFLERMKLVYELCDLDINVDIFPITEEEYEKRKNEISILGEGIREGILVEI